MLRLISTSLYKLLWYNLIVPWLLKCVGLYHPWAYHVLPWAALFEVHDSPWAVQIPHTSKAIVQLLHLQFLLLLLPPVASAPTNLMAIQEGLTGIGVSWTPPTPLGDTTGYRIYYSSGSSGSVDVSGGSTDNHLLTGLQNGTSYTISIVGTSKHFFSDRVDYPNSIPLSEFLQLVSVFQRGTS